MTPTEEARFIELWNAGTPTAEIAVRLDIPEGTARSRAYTLQQQGKITPRPRGGRRTPARKQDPAEPTVHRPPSPIPPSTVDPTPSTVHPPPADLTAAVTAALQPVLARLEALEAGLAPQPPDDRPPSTIHHATVDGPPAHGPRSTVHPATWELKQLKHSVRWTVYVPQAMKEELQRRAAARGQNPSLLIQEALAWWLGEEGR